MKVKRLLSSSNTPTKQFNATWRNEGSRIVGERKVEYSIGPYRSFSQVMEEIEKQFGATLYDHDLGVELIDRHAWVVVDPRGHRSQRATTLLKPGKKGIVNIGPRLRD